MQISNSDYHEQATTQPITYQNHRLSVNCFLYENPERLAYLVEKYNFDKHKQFGEGEEILYLWSVIKPTQKALKFEILRLVIDLIYKNSTDEEKRTVLLLSNWFMFVKKIERPFKLINNSLSTAPLVSIWCLYQYILKGTPVKAIDEYSQPVGLDGCCVCLDLPSSQRVHCDECSRAKLGFICEPCYNSLQVMRCPCCRSESIRFVETPLNLLRKVSFMHNRREYTRDLTLSTGFTLCYYDGDFRSTPISVETFGELCIKAVGGFFDNFSPEDSGALYSYILPQYAFLFPHQHIFKEYVYALPLETETQILTNMTGLGVPWRAHDFYSEHIGNIYSVSPLDFDSLHVERISFGNGASTLFVNLPEGCYVLSLAKNRNGYQPTCPSQLSNSFYVITP
jgi:hypothetical protein